MVATFLFFCARETATDHRYLCWTDRRGFRLCAADLVENRAQIPHELFRILAHREVAKPRHDRGFAAGNACRDLKGLLRRTRIVVLARQQKQRTFFGIDQCDALADITVALIEMQVAFEYARP